MYRLVVRGTYGAEIKLQVFLMKFLEKRNFPILLLAHKDVHSNPTSNRHGNYRCTVVVATVPNMFNCTLSQIRLARLVQFVSICVSAPKPAVSRDGLCKKVLHPTRLPLPNKIRHANFPSPYAQAFCIYLGQQRGLNKRTPFSESDGKCSQLAS